MAGIKITKCRRRTAHGLYLKAVPVTESVITLKTFTKECLFDISDISANGWSRLSMALMLIMSKKEAGDRDERRI